MLRVLTVAVVVCAVCMTSSSGLGLGRRDRRAEIAGPASGKLSGRRITRNSYTMGYMFGKRSGLPDTTSLILKALRNPEKDSDELSVDDLGLILQSDADLALQVARHLDTDGDDYVSVGELL